MRRFTGLLSLFVAYLILALLLAPAGAVGGDVGVLESPEIVVSFDQPLAGMAQGLRDTFPEVRTELERVLRLKLKSRPLVLLVASRAEFEKMSGTGLISAFAVPTRGSIVINIPSLGHEPYLLRETFKHELCHLMLHDHIRSNLLPRWLDEGVCQWVSGSLGEVLIGREGGFAGPIDLSRGTIPLSKLAEAFPNEKHELLLAYEESRSVTDYINSRFGKEDLLGILYRLADGNNIDSAVREVLGISLSELESSWRDDVASRSRFAIWVSQYMYELLFVGGALLTIVGFARYFIRLRRMPDEEEESEDEDEAEPDWDYGDAWRASGPEDDKTGKRQPCSPSTSDCDRGGRSCEEFSYEDDPGDSDPPRTCFGCCDPGFEQWEDEEEPDEPDPPPWWARGVRRVRPLSCPWWDCHPRSRTGEPDAEPEEKDPGKRRAD